MQNEIILNSALNFFKLGSNIFLLHGEINEAEDFKLKLTSIS